MKGTPDSIIADGHIIEGELHGSGLMQVLGIIRGTIDFDGTVFVDSGGRIEGTVQASHIVVAGVIDGTVHGRDLVEVTEQGHLIGKCDTVRMVVADGGLIDSQLVIHPS